MKRPCILVFDSLRTKRRARVVATLRQYLEYEYKAKIKEQQVGPSSVAVRQPIFDACSMPACCPRVPQQPDFSDCGVFVLQYVEAFFNNPIRSYTLPLGDTLAFDWFPAEAVQRKRTRVARLIRRLASEQNPSVQFEFPNLNFLTSSSSSLSLLADDDDKDHHYQQRRSEKNGGGSRLMAATYKPSSFSTYCLSKASGENVQSTKRIWENILLS